MGTQTGAEWRTDPNSFRFDRGALTLFGGLITAILLQTGSFIWWASHISSSIIEMERRLTIVEAWRENQGTQSAQNVRVQTQVEEIVRRLDRLEIHFLQVPPSQPPPGRP
jgi:hypothetical protein